MFRPFWDESSLGFFDQEIILREHFLTSCVGRLRGALISITNRQIRETRWLAKPDVWFNIRLHMLNAHLKWCTDPRSKLLGLIDQKKVLHIRQSCCKFHRAIRVTQRAAW